MRPGFHACAALLVLACANLHAGDANKNRVDDSLDVAIAEQRDIIKSPSSSLDDKRTALAKQRESIAVEFIFSKEPTPEQDRIAALARVQVQQRLSATHHGWIATAPLDGLVRIAQQLGPDLLLIYPQEPITVEIVRMQNGELIKTAWRGGPVTPADFDELLEEFKQQPNAAGALLSPAPGAATKADALWQRGIAAFAPADATEETQALTSLTLLYRIREKRPDYHPTRTDLAELAEIPIDQALMGITVPLQPPITFEFTPQQPLHARLLELDTERLTWFELRHPPQLVLQVKTIPQADVTLSKTATGSSLAIDSDHHASVALLLTSSGTGSVHVSKLPAFAKPPDLMVPFPVHEPPPTTATLSLPSVPLRTSPIIDGTALEYGEAQLVCNTVPSTPDLKLNALRMAHDNDFLYLHIATTAPVAPDNATGFWIFADVIPTAKEGHSAGQFASGPPAITQGMSGVIFERNFSANRIFFIENLTTTNIRLFAIWCFNTQTKTAENWGDMFAGPPSSFRPDYVAPIGFSAAFANSAVYESAAASDTSGIEMRIPLSALGLAAPLAPSHPPHPMKFLIGAGRADTGEWSNQVFSTVPIEHPLGGGIYGTKPDFLRNRATVSGEPIIFDGIQTIDYTVDYVPRR